MSVTGSRELSRVFELGRDRVRLGFGKDRSVVKWRVLEVGRLEISGSF